MSIKEITKFTSPNSTAAADVLAVFGDPRIVKSITIHHWGKPSRYDYNGAFNNVIAYLCRRNGNTSAHYVVEGGRIACIIDPDNASWAAGHSRGNAQSIHIEMNPRASRADYKAVAALVASLREVYGDVPLHEHSYWTPTSCPGIYNIAKIDRMARKAAKRGNAVKPAADSVKPVNKPKPESKPRPKQKPAPKKGLYWTVEPGDTLGGIADHYAVSVDELARYNHLGNPNVIHVGQHIRIPGPLFWTVQRGDSLSAIAAYYGLSYKALERNAGLVGQRPIIGTTIRVI